jgi:hypothetical protein
MAEVFTIEFDPGVTYNLVEDRRQANLEGAAPSACMAFISVIDDEDGKNRLSLIHPYRRRPLEPCASRHRTAG